MTTIDNFNFSFSPNIINILGQELIHDKKIAIMELVKNAYDADATNVDITIGNKEIIIKDDGCGMNKSIIKNYWLQAGNSPKKGEVKRTEQYQRLPLGEKGVGRLGVHRLGKNIEVISKTANDKEVEFSINWENFEGKEKITEVSPIAIIENNDPKIFLEGETGTQLTIKNLRENFSNEKEMANLEQDLFKLLSPFKDVDNKFSIKLFKNEGLFKSEKVFDIEKLKKEAFFYFCIAFKKTEITYFEYKCCSSDRKEERKLELKDLEKDLENLIKSSKAREENLIFLDSQDLDLGDIIFQGCIFEHKLSQNLNQPISRDIKDYLKENGGIRVYRDGIRIYNYGEEGKDNDILNLDRKRAKKLGDFIGYNQILAAIELDRESSKDLKEKTNREGFIHNESFKYLQDGLDFCMGIISFYRKQDKARLDKLVGKEYDKGDVDTKINEIVKNIDNLEVQKDKRENLKKQLFEFSKYFQELKNIFLSASNTGLNLAFIIHEVDKIIDHLGEELKGGNIEKVNKVFKHLKETIIIYRDTIRLSKEESSHKLDSIFEQAIFSVNYRFKVHEITLQQEIQSGLVITCRKNFILGTINNLFDNAIYWLEFYQIKDKKIILKAYEHDKELVIVIADNGKGFNIPFDSALRPFISGRFDSSSMGIGLHLADQIMNAHQGQICLGDWQKENLPQEYENGAILKLIFPQK